MRSLSLLVLLLPLAACGSDDVAVVSPDAAIDAAGCDPTTALPTQWRPIAMVSTGAVNVTTAGGVTSGTIDATAGGTAAAADNPYVYLDLMAGTKVDLTDTASLTSTAWHVGFKRAGIKLNGGDSGPGQVAAAVVNPRTGRVYVTNTEAHNHTRFEGHAPGFTSVRGRVVDHRVTVLDPATRAVTPRDLNPHIDYAGEGDAAERARSVAQPQDAVVSRDGRWLYVVAQGSGKLAAYRTADLEAGTIAPDLDDQIGLSGGGPSGVVLDRDGDRAFVLTRFDNSISIVDLRARAEIGKVGMFNPEPESVQVGRQYLYDADFSSGHGVAACSTCHVGGDNDDRDHRHRVGPRVEQERAHRAGQVDAAQVDALAGGQLDRRGDLLHALVSGRLGEDPADRPCAIDKGDTRANQ